jgi:hypothetical protein
MQRVIVLTGAPAQNSLSWDEDATLAEPGGDDREWTFEDAKTSEPSSAFSAQWRQVPMMRLQANDNRNTAVSGQPMFLRTPELTSPSRFKLASPLTSGPLASDLMPTTQGLDDYYEKSFSFHEDHQNTQLSRLQSQASSSFCSTWEAGGDDGSPLSTHTEHVPRILPFELSLQLNNINDIPSAEYLAKINPQTMTVNMVVAILKLPPPRQVAVGRRWGREQQVQLVEMLVGDDTRTGFEITVWLPNGKSDDNNSLELSMKTVRAHDIVLLQNVALRAYRGRVHGQSLRRNVTKMHLLYRGLRPRSETKAVYFPNDLLEPTENDSVLTKASRVKKWQLNFVGHDSAMHKVGALPPESQ